MIKGTRKRSLVKTISWRIVGTLDTMLISWIITGSFKWGVAIGSVEVVTKMVLYYLHERAWYKSSYGIDKTTSKK
jgi:uncharacterized membrane protein